MLLWRESVSNAHLRRFFLRGVISPVPSQVMHFCPWIFPVPRHTGHILAGDLGEDDIKGSSPTLYSKTTSVNKQYYC